ncbi:hypothetical protein MSIMFI_00303 [Mycobacterium simulans]|nr:hypothetical protein MSIMFI_00303 [Mycobacterium simulans]
MIQGLVPSIGAVGEARDNALCETTIGQQQTEHTTSAWAH